MEEKYKIHAFYVLTILISIIIVLLTVKWSQIENLASYINFALTLTSLVLAVLAIIYAFYFNTAFSKNIAALDNISRDVSETAEELSIATRDLSHRVENIPPRLESMEVKVDQTNVLLRQYTENVDLRIPTENEKRVASEIIKTFIERISHNGLLLLYIYSLAYVNKVEFNIYELLSSVSNINVEYGKGFVSATKAAGLIASKSKQGMVNVTYMSEELRNQIEIELPVRLDRNENNMSEQEFEEFRKSMQNMIDTIEKYFKSLPKTAEA